MVIFHRLIMCVCELPKVSSTWTLIRKRQIHISHNQLLVTFRLCKVTVLSYSLISIPVPYLCHPLLNKPTKQVIHEDLGLCRTVAIKEIYLLTLLIRSARHAVVIVSLNSTLAHFSETCSSKEDEIVMVWNSHSHIVLSNYAWHTVIILVGDSVLCWIALGTTCGGRPTVTL